MSVPIYLEVSNDLENDPHASVHAAGDGIDAREGDMLRLSSLSGTGLEVFTNFTGTGTSTSIAVIAQCLGTQHARVGTLR